MKGNRLFLGGESRLESTRDGRGGADFLSALLYSMQGAINGTAARTPCCVVKDGCCRHFVGARVALRFELTMGAVAALALRSMTVDTVRQTHGPHSTMSPAKCVGPTPQA